MRLFSHLRSGTAVALACALVMPFSTPAFAQSGAAIDAKHRVNIAGRQRMLSQRMTKAACFIYLGVEREQNVEALLASYNLFWATHDALRSGDADVGLGAEINPGILAALKDVDRKWVAYSPLVSDVMINGATDNNDVATLDALGLEVLDSMNVAVGIIARAYGENLEDLPVILSLTIDLAGRQRMFTQKMAKDFCLIDAGINIEGNRADLKETLELFNLTLEGLKSGLPGLMMAAPNYDIRMKLAEVDRLWQPIDKVLARIAAGGEISDRERRVVAVEIEAVLDAMDKAVGMYEFVVHVPE